MRSIETLFSTSPILAAAVMVIMILTISATGAFAEGSTHKKMGDKDAMHKGSMSKSDMSMMHGSAYPLDTCSVTGMKLGSMGDPIAYNHEGRDIKFCCVGCIGKFESDPATYIKKIDDGIKKNQAADYPLDTCVISGEKIGGMMGKPVDIVHDNRLVRLCCNACGAEFKKDPAKHLAKIDKAVIDMQKEHYPMMNCVVNPSHKLGEKAVNHVHANKLVRVCSDSCAAEFNKNPTKHMDTLNSAMMSNDKMMKKDAHK
jgi:YHS domain-containing protein